MLRAIASEISDVSARGTTTVRKRLIVVTIKRKSPKIVAAVRENRSRSSDWTSFTDLCWHDEPSSEHFGAVL